MELKQLSELEQEVMNIIWKIQTCSIRDIFNILNKERNLAYTTVATVMQRLYDKGLLRRKDSGVHIIFSPKFSKEYYSRNVASSFINKFFEHFGDAAFVSFAKSIENLPKLKKKYLISLLEDHDNAK